MLRLIKPSSPGNIFVQVDQAGAEALVVAYLCRPGKFRDLFINKIKPHTYVAMGLYKNEWLKETNGLDEELFNLPISSLASHPQWKPLSTRIKNDPTRYYIGKKTCHSGNYGIGPRVFREAVLKDSEGSKVISLREAGYFLSSYHSMFPEIREWHDEVIRRAKSEKVLRNLFGYERVIYENPEHNPKELYAHVPQSTVGTITNRAFEGVFNRINFDEPENWEECYLLNNKHDSILGECPVETKERFARLIADKLEVTLEGWTGDIFKMGTGISFGRNWDSWDEKYNPEGMKEI